MTHNHQSWDTVTEQTAVTSNPAAGVISVDVKTFTGRGRVSAVVCTCVADANASNRYLQVQKVSGANVVLLASGIVFTATQTGSIYAMRGWTIIPATSVYATLADVEFAPGDILRVVTAFGQAGDDMSAITYSFKEML